MTIELEIHPLTRDRLPDLATLFNQGGDPKWCWCAYYRLRSVDFSSGSAQRNRGVLEGAVETTADERRNPGLVAYRDGEAVGWVSVGPRDDYERLQHSKVLAPVDDKPVWSIVCFVVARKARGQGVATALLDAAVDYAREHGATLLRRTQSRPMADASRPPMPTRARSGCSSGPASRSSNDGAGMPPRRRGRSCAAHFRAAVSGASRPRSTSRGPACARRRPGRGGHRRRRPRRSAPSVRRA